MRIDQTVDSVPLRHCITVAVVADLRYASPMGQVRIGTCSGPADAALVRSVFAAHDLRVFVSGEQHANMLGGMAGTFLSLDIWVAEEDAEEAAALLHEVRNHQPGGDEDEIEESDAEPEDDHVVHRIDRRRGTGIVILLGVCVTFGTAHMYTRAWLRGMALAGFELFAFRYFAVQPAVAAAMLAGCVAADLIGALVRVRSNRPTLPRARLRR